MRAFVVAQTRSGTCACVLELVLVLVLVLVLSEAEKRSQCALDCESIIHHWSKGVCLLHVLDGVLCRNKSCHALDTSYFQLCF